MDAQYQLNFPNNFEIFNNFIVRILDETICKFPNIICIDSDSETCTNDKSNITMFRHTSNLFDNITKQIDEPINDMQQDEPHNLYICIMLYKQQDIITIIIKSDDTNDAVKQFIVNLEKKISKFGGFSKCAKMTKNLKNNNQHNFAIEQKNAKLDRELNAQLLLAHINNKNLNTDLNIHTNTHTNTHKHTRKLDKKLNKLIHKINSQTNSQIEPYTYQYNYSNLKMGLDIQHPLMIKQNEQQFTVSI